MQLRNRKIYNKSSELMKKKEPLYIITENLEEEVEDPSVDEEEYDESSADEDEVFEPSADDMQRLYKCYEFIKDKNRKRYHDYDVPVESVFLNLLSNGNTLIRVSVFLFAIMCLSVYVSMKFYNVFYYYPIQTLLGYFIYFNIILAFNRRQLNN